MIEYKKIRDFGFLSIFLSGCGCTELPQKCMSSIEGVSYFVGNIKCLSQLSKQNINGYWVVDHEYSVFYDNINSIKDGYDTEAYWVELSPDYMQKKKIYFSVNERTIYKISFTGTKSDTVGIYGNGNFRKGILMYEITNIKKLNSIE